MRQNAPLQVLGIFSGDHFTAIGAKEEWAGVNETHRHRAMPARTSQWAMQGSNLRPLADRLRARGISRSTRSHEARLSVAERMAGIRKFGVHLAKKGLAFHSKESVNVLIGGRRSRRRTLRPGDRADPGLASVRGRNWFGPSRDGGFEDVIQT